MWLEKYNNEGLVSYPNWVNRFFNDFWGADLTNVLSNIQEDSVVWSPRADVEETENAYRVHADLPGINKNDLKVTMQNNTLTIQAERKHEEEENKKNSWYRKERFYGSFQRSFVLPNHVKADAIKADYKDGVLMIEVPKSEEAQPRAIEIK